MAENTYDFDKNLLEKLANDKTPIEILDLSRRTYNALKRVGIDTIKEICPIFTSDMHLYIKNYGEKSTQETFDAIAEYYKEKKEVESKEDDQDISVEKLPLNEITKFRLINAGILKKSDLLKSFEKNYGYLAPKVGQKTIQDIEQYFKQNIAESQYHETSESIEYSLQIRIEELELSPRTYNALKRSNINFLSELNEILAEDGFHLIRNFGEIAQNELRKKYHSYLDDHDIELEVDQIQGEGLTSPKISKSQLEQKVKERLKLEFKELIRKLQELIEIKQLHPKVTMNEIPLCEFITISPESPPITQLRKINAVIKIDAIESNLNTDIFKLLNKLGINDRYKFVLYLRGGLPRLTLQGAGEKLGVTRERIRQIESSIKRKLKHSWGKYNLLFLKSSVLFFCDLESKVSINKWKSFLIDTLGFEDSMHHIGAYGEISAFDWLISLITFLSRAKLEIPKNFLLALEHPEQSIASINLSSKFPKQSFRNARRAVNNGGAFYLPTIAKEINHDVTTTKGALEILGYSKIKGNWMTLLPDKNSPHNRPQIINNTLLILYCISPIHIDEIQEGVQQIARRIGISVAPSNILIKYFLEFGFTVKNDKVSFDGKNETILLGRNKIFFELINKKGPVVTFQEVCDEFESQEYSRASAIQLLQFSPIVKKVNFALYTLRGENITPNDFMEANERRERIEANVEKSYTLEGEIHYKLNIGSWALRGVISLPELDALEGKWNCNYLDNNYCEPTVSENLIYGLGSPINSIDAQLGDRIELIFNTWTRELIIRKVNFND